MWKWDPAYPSRCHHCRNDSHSRPTASSTRDWQSNCCREGQVRAKPTRRSVLMSACQAANGDLTVVGNASRNRLAKIQGCIKIADTTHNIVNVSSARNPLTKSAHTSWMRVLACSFNNAWNPVSVILAWRTWAAETGYALSKRSRTTDLRAEFPPGPRVQRQQASTLISTKRNVNSLRVQADDTNPETEHACRRIVLHTQALDLKRTVNCSCAVQPSRNSFRT